MWNNSAVTNGGITILSKWMSGGALTITRAKLGTGTVAANTLISQTDVKTYAADAGIIAYKEVSNGVQYTVRISPGTSAFVAKQIGIYGKIGTGTETLIAIYQDDTGISVPSSSDMSEFVYDFYAVVASGVGANITVNISSQLYVTAAELATKQDKINDLAAIRSGAAAGATAVQPAAMAAKQDKLTAGGGVTITGNVISTKKVYGAQKAVGLYSGYNEIVIDYSGCGFSAVPYVAATITPASRSSGSRLSATIIRNLHVQVYGITNNSCVVSVYNDGSASGSIGVQIVAVGD